MFTEVVITEEEYVELMRKAANIVNASGVSPQDLKNAAYPIILSDLISALAQEKTWSGCDACSGEEVEEGNI